MLCVVDEFTGEALAVKVDRRLNSSNAIETLVDLMLQRWVPVLIRSDNAPEFVAKVVRGWIAAADARTAYIDPVSPWENGDIERFNSKLRDELLDGEIFFSLKKPRSPWRRGDGTTTLTARIRPLDGGRRHLPWWSTTPLGRISHPNPSWRAMRPSISIHPGSVIWGWTRYDRQRFAQFVDHPLRSSNSHETAQNTDEAHIDINIEVI